MRPQGQQSLLFVSQGISTAGNYDIVQDEALIKKVAYNYNAKESEMLFLSMSEIKKMANTLQVNIVNNAGIVSSSYGSGNIKNLWKLFLILTLLALVAEMSVQKWLK
jgi:hypothetical protein